MWEVADDELPLPCFDLPLNEPTPARPGPGARATRAAPLGGLDRIVLMGEGDGSSRVERVTNGVGEVRAKFLRWSRP